MANVVYQYSVVIPNHVPDMIPDMKCLPFQDTVIIEVCFMFGIDKENLYERCRIKKIKYARWIIWEIMYVIGGLKLKEVAEIFGKYDHTTVCNAFDKLPDDIDNIEWLEFAWSNTMRKLSIDVEKIKKFRKDRKTRNVKPKFIISKKYRDKKFLNHVK